MKKSLLLLSALGMSSAFAATELKDCVIQEVIPGKNMTGAFLTFEHKGETVEIKSGEIASVTPSVEFHQMVMKGDVMEMAPLEDLKIAEGERMFRKGADHIMLMQIPEDKFPKKGEKHTITVHFSDGSKASCEAEVKTVEEVIEAAKAAGDAHAAHGHGHGHAHGDQKPADAKKH